MGRHLASYTTLTDDLQHFSAEVVYGITLLLLGERLASQPALTPYWVQNFATSLKESLASLRPVQPRTSSATIFASQDLDSCSHIFLRVESVKRPLQQSYQGPFKVLRRTRKMSTLDVSGASQTVGVDRVNLSSYYRTSHPQSPPLSHLSLSPVPLHAYLDHTPERRFRFSFLKTRGEEASNVVRVLRFSVCALRLTIFFHTIPYISGMTSTNTLTSHFL